MNCDLLIMIGSDYPYSDFLPSKAKIIQIDERVEVLGRRVPTVLGVLGSAAPTLKLLLSQLKEKKDPSFFDQVTIERQERSVLCNDS